MSTLLTRVVTSLSGSRMSQSSKEFIVESKVGLCRINPVQTCSKLSRKRGESRSGPLGQERG